MLSPLTIFRIPLIILCQIGIVLYSTVCLATTNVDPEIIEKNRLQLQTQEEESRRQSRNVPQDPKANFDIKALSLLPKGQDCQWLKHIWLYGADHISDSERTELFKPFMPECQDNEGLARIARSLQVWYLKHGYVTTRISIKKEQSSLDKGNYELWVSEGRIDQIIIADNSFFNQLRTRSAFPSSKGDVLNIYNLDQGLEQLNRLYSQKFRMQIVPSTIPAYSNIKLIEHFNDSSYILDKPPGRHRGRHRLNYNYNNDGSDGTGKNLHKFTFTRENLIGLNDIYALSWQRAIPFQSGIKENETLRLNTSMPWGKWYFNFSTYRGKTLQKLPPSISSNTDVIVSKGDIRTQQLTINRLLIRGKNYKLASLVKTDRSRRKNFINETEILVQARTIASFNLGTIYTHYFPRSIVISSLTLSKGRPWFGGLGDKEDITDAEPHADYTSYRLYSYYSHNLLANSPYQFSVQSVLNSQYSSVELYGENQFIVGGEYSIRGFKDNITSYSSGWTIKNDVSAPVGIWLARWYDYNNLLPLRLKFFIDFGRGYDRSFGKQPMFAGSGIGVDYNHRWVTLSLNHAKAFRSPAEPESWITNVHISSEISF